MKIHVDDSSLQSYKKQKKESSDKQHDGLSLLPIYDFCVMSVVVGAGQPL